MENEKTINKIWVKVKCERTKLLGKLRSVEAAIQYLESILGKQPSNLITISDKGKYKSMSAPRAAEEVLREHGEPLHIKKIIKKMYEGGFSRQDNKRKLYHNLYSAMLSRKKYIFCKILRNPAYFGLVEWQAQ